jgi:hypothetical protein
VCSGDPPEGTGCTCNMVESRDDSSFMLHILGIALFGASMRRAKRAASSFLPR